MVSWPARRRTRHGCRSVSAVAATLAAVVAAVLAGCSGGGSGGGPSAPGSNPPATVNTHVIQRSTTPGGTLRVLGQADCPSWDPARAVSGPCRDAQRLISRQLVTYAAAPGPARLVGDLATAVPGSPDGRTWTYHLRPGLFFSDGERLTSADVKYALRRLFLGTPAAGAPSLVRDLLTPPRAPASPGSSASPSTPASLPTVSTPDELTVTIHLNRPYYGFNDLMATPVSSPVPPAADGADYGVNPVSSGPYLINFYDPGHVLTLTRNPRWDTRTDPVRPALPDRIQLTFGLGPAAIDSRLLDDAADLEFEAAGVLGDLRSRLAVSLPALTGRTSTDVTSTVHYLAVVTTSAPFGDLRCRQAVAWGVDRSAVLAARGAGGGVAATALLSPVTAGYQPANPFPTSDGGADPARARAALKRCPSGGGIVTKLASPDDPTDLATAQALSAALTGVGITVTVVPFPASGYDTRVLGSPETLRTHSIGLALGAAVPAWDAPDAQLAPLVAAAPAANPAGLDGQPAREALSVAMATGSDTGREAKLTAVAASLLTSAAYVPLAYDQPLNLYSTRLSNVYYATAFAAPDLVALGVVP